MQNKTILFIGGSGYLGTNFIARYINDNIIVNYSRNESKQWELLNKFKNHKNLKNIIGDIADYEKLQKSIREINPNIIIIASALKHINYSEFDIHSSLRNNIEGIQNLYKLFYKKNYELLGLETVCFISSDKACNPISTYGICKALAEKIMQEMSNKIKNIKFITVRYGNVLDSSGSLIPLIKQKIINKEPLSLTHPEMTRFVMPVQQSIDLIEYAIKNGENGQIIVPKMLCIKVKDVFEIFCEEYGVGYTTSTMRFVEKINEELINKTQSLFTEIKGNYYHIHPCNSIPCNSNSFSVKSCQNILNKKELKEILLKYHLLLSLIHI